MVEKTVLRFLYLICLCVCHSISVSQGFKLFPSIPFLDSLKLPFISTDNPEQNANTTNQEPIKPKDILAYLSPVTSASATLDELKKVVDSLKLTNFFNTTEEKNEKREKRYTPNNPKKLNLEEIEKWLDPVTSASATKEEILSTLRQIIESGLIRRKKRSVDSSSPSKQGDGNWLQSLTTKVFNVPKEALYTIKKQYESGKEAVLGMLDITENVANMILNTYFPENDSDEYTNDVTGESSDDSNEDPSKYDYLEKYSSAEEPESNSTSTRRKRNLEIDFKSLKDGLKYILNVAKESIEEEIDNFTREVRDAYTQLKRNILEIFTGASFYGNQLEKTKIPPPLSRSKRSLSDVLSTLLNYSLGPYKAAFDGIVYLGTTIKSFIDGSDSAGKSAAKHKREVDAIFNGVAFEHQREKRELKFYDDMKKHFQSLGDKIEEAAQDGYVATKRALVDSFDYLKGLGDRAVDNLHNLGRKKRSNNKIILLKREISFGPLDTAFSRIEEAYRLFYEDFTKTLKQFFDELLDYAIGLIQMRLKSFYEELFKLKDVLIEESNENKNESLRRKREIYRGKDVYNELISRGGDVGESAKYWLSSLLESGITKLQATVAKLSRELDEFKNQILVRDGLVNSRRRRSPDTTEKNTKNVVGILEFLQNLKKGTIGDKVSKNRAIESRKRRSPDSWSETNSNIVGVKTFKQDLDTIAVGDDADSRTDSYPTTTS